MKLIRFGITLRRITIDDIEMVRNARNAVRHLMDFQEYITQEMQLKWFNSINNPNNFYYIIEYQNESVGLIHEKNVSIEPGVKYEDSEGGIFLFDEKYYSSPAPVLAALTLIEKGFYIFGDTESIIHIMKGNDAAVRFNQDLGYVLCEGQENKTKQKYILTKERFEEKTNKLRKAAIRLSKSDNCCVAVFSKEDYETGLGPVLEKINKQVGLKPIINESGERVYTIDFDKY